MSSNDSEKGIRQGTVLKKAIGSYFVQEDGKLVTCSISSKLRRKLLFPSADPSSIRPHVVGVKDIDTVDPVAVGDRVRFIDAQDGTGLITEVLPRKSKLVRKNPGRKALEQVIVANVDQVFPVMAAARPEPKWNLLDRYLISAESLGLPSVICITKLDLIDEGEELFDEVEYYQAIGYPVILTSTVTGEGLVEMQSALQDRLSVLIGKSGVGKTSLLNAIEPEFRLKVREISSATGKGKHTTTNLEMLSLSLGGAVVDTPGMREFGLWEVDGTDLASLFPEMRPAVGACRFGWDCSHVHEPGCAILEAVSQGKISERRYQSYLRLGSEVK
jgi:ribosome biogenesis GTPase / thiamine phosphate phosphatase